MPEAKQVVERQVDAFNARQGRAGRDLTGAMRSTPRGLGTMV